MTAKDFFNLVSEMRKNQKDYFKTRSSESLRKSKRNWKSKWMMK